MRRSLWEKAPSGFRYAQRENVSRKAPQQAYRQQGSAFFVHGQPSLKPKIQEGIEGAVHQIRRTERQQQHQRHRFRSGQHGAAGRGVPKALHRLGGQGVAPSKAMTNTTA